MKVKGKSCMSSIILALQNEGKEVLINALFYTKRIQDYTMHKMSPLNEVSNHCVQEVVGVTCVPLPQYFFVQVP